MRFHLLLWFAMIALAVPPVAAEEAGPVPLTLEEIFAGDALDGHLPGRVMWLPDGEHFISRRLREGKTYLVEESAETGETREIVDWGGMQDKLLAERPGYVRPLAGDPNASGGQRWRPALSPDGRWLVGSAADDLFALDLKTGLWHWLTDKPGQELFPSFSPGGQTLAFVREGQIHLLSIADGSERRITSSPSGSGIQNGMADWVYEEELGIQRSFWWRPQGTHIAFVQYDTSPVGVYPIVNDLGDYGALERQRYPLAGTANSKVRLGLIDLGTGRIKWIQTPAEADNYLVRVGWTPDGSKLWYQWLNRDQTVMELRFADPGSGRSTTVLREQDRAWVNDLGGPVFVSEGRFAWVSEREGWRHLYLYDSAGHLLRRLTSGEWEVREVYGPDGSGRRLLYQSNQPDPRERQIYSIALDGGSPRPLTAEPGTHDALLAPGGRYFLDTYSSLETPPRVDLRDAEGKALRVVVEGAIPALDRHALAPYRSHRLKAEDGTWLYSIRLEPPHLEPGRRYPVLLYVYGGPESQLVTNRWGGSRHLFYQYLAQEGFIVFWLDNRGTTGRGRDFERVIHRRLGEIELRDQLAGVEYIKSLPYVDPERIGVYGGSYGGTMTLLAMLRAPKTFRAGIAYAPVTDWRLYDSIYTERYMDQPEDNEEGYRESAPLTYADRLQGDLLLFHGTMDNNVHVQNTMRLVDAFVTAGKSFHLMLYPGIRHGIRISSHVRLPFHREKVRFLLKYLAGKESPSEITEKP